MKKAKILSVVGARPQFIKAAVMSRVLKKKYDEILVHTGQHYDADMSANFFKELQIPEPDYNLGVGSTTHGKQVAFMLQKIEEILLKEKPTLVLVYGDTNSTLAGALAASKLNFPIAHIEAGLRSFRKDMPEEINRIVTDHLSTYLFCPSKNAVNNLRKEGILKGVYNVGDVMCDAVLFYLVEARKKSKILSMLNITRKSYFLATIHRAENTESKDRLKKIIEILDRLNSPVIFPSHPRTRKAMNEFKIVADYQKIRFIKPVSYFDMLTLEANAKAILTDSGGVQKEALFLGTPCITLREETEWIETIVTKRNILTGIDKNKILEGLKIFSKNNSFKVTNDYPYGNGHATNKIMDIIKKEVLK